MLVARVARKGVERCARGNMPKYGSCASRSNMPIYGSCVARAMGTFAKDNRRFYKDVDVIETTGAMYQVKLDNKYNVRTPLRNIMLLPTVKLANAVALEWDSQKDNVIFALMPLTQLCSRAIDQPIPKEELIEHMLEFLTTDTVCYRAPVSDEMLHRMEVSRWDPLTQWFSEYHHVHLALTTDITLTPQSQQTIDRLRKHLQTQNTWTIPAFHSSVTSLKSFVIASALLDGGLSAEEAIACSHLETDFQIDRWGEVEWQHTLDRARMSADVAAAVLLVNEVQALSEERLVTSLS